MSMADSDRSKAPVGGLGVVESDPFVCPLQTECTNERRKV